MAETVSPLRQLIKKLDLLDGKEDGKYSGYALHERNATGLCEAAEDVAAKVCKKQKKGCDIKVQMSVSKDKNIAIDCKKLVSTLSYYVDIAKRLPATAFVAQKDTDTPKAKTELFGRLTFDDLFAYRVVDHMICALLLGIGTTDEPLHLQFSHARFSDVTKWVHWMGDATGRDDFRKSEARTHPAAYAVFEKLGKKYGFATAPFAPVKKPQPDDGKRAR